MTSQLLEDKQKQRDYLIHRVFYQNEDGAKLLELWSERLMRPVAQSGMSPLDIGIEQGMTNMVLGIHQTIKAVNEGTK